MNPIMKRMRTYASSFHFPRNVSMFPGPPARALPQLPRARIIVGAFAETQSRRGRFYIGIRGVLKGAASAIGSSDLG
jgi:hypothetical protein